MVQHQSLTCTISWAVVFAILAWEFIRSAYLDWKGSKFKSSRSCINLMAMAYCVITMITLIWLDRGLQDKDPPVVWLVLTRVSTFLNFTITTFMLYRYMDICGSWLSSSCLLRTKSSSAGVCMFLIGFWLACDMFSRPLAAQTDSPKFHKSHASYVPWLLPTYYIVFDIQELLCLVFVFHLHRQAKRGNIQVLQVRPGSSNGVLIGISQPISAELDLLPAIRRVLKWNCLLMFVSLCMVIIETTPLKRALMEHGLYGWPMLVLYSARFFCVWRLARPQPDFSDAQDNLHFGGRGLQQNYCFSKGAGLVICNSKYHNLKELDGRQQEDAERFRRAFELLGFEMDVKYDCTAEEIRQCLHEKVTSCAANELVDGFALVCLAHGDNDSIFGVDVGFPTDAPEHANKGAVQIHDIAQDMWAPLAGKPKLLFFDTCRGGRFERRGLSAAVVSESAERTLSRRDGWAQRGQPPPLRSVYADFLYCFATAEDHLAYSCEDSGRGVFSKAFLEVLNISTQPGAHPVDICHVLTKVIDSVSQQSVGRNGGNKRQCPNFTSHLTKRLMLKTEVELVPRFDSSIVSLDGGANPLLS